jgi:NAD(P)-dependent dehydrogenase (short-subunit alcohol dehydrogenase family)
MAPSHGPFTCVPRACLRPRVSATVCPQRIALRDSPKVGRSTHKGRTTVNPETMFDIRGLRVVVTGGGGVLCGAMARGLATLGAHVAVVDLIEEKAQAVADDIVAAGGETFAVACDATVPDSISALRDAVLARWGTVDALVNGAGGNHPKATTTPEMPFFALAPDAFRQVFDTNFFGTLLASQAFGEVMARQGRGAIVNIASMNAIRPLTRIPAYSSAKAAVANLTQWLAVYMAQEYSPDIRVNAIAPGFFLTEQTRYLHIDPQTGAYTARGQQIVAHTPAGRMGSPDELLSTLVWLICPGSSFVTGIVVPVDGGFSAYSGV